MAANGINTVRTYTVPPRWLLDMAQQNDLYVMIGLPWEQHITFLDDKKRARDIEKRVAAGVKTCTGHPAVLCYAIGNEIPASIVRWHGRRRVERFLKRLYHAAKSEDAGGLVTYVNYPTTEYLQLPFLDFVCFNVYLESQERLENYLARLQNIAGDRPLLMTEVGLDSRRNGKDAQARVLDWQVRTAFAAGSAGALVFSWTDEWHRGGYDIDDWDFGLVDRQRYPKPALAAVREAFVEAPFSPALNWPRISVVVCSYNGSRTIRECCEGLKQLQYPNYEVIVVNDGSTDSTAKVVGEFDYRLISTENMGLSHARNLGLKAATGEIVAYLDDDAFPDPHWLTYLAAAFMRSQHVGIGGPNITIKEDGWLAECVGNSPGNPTHILLTDLEAEHIPGCNMAFRKEALEAIGGFDPQFRIAGDDVDVCWRLQQAGGALGFSPAAMVWHHRRNSVQAYWKQQINYGKAEALLEMKWPEKYNRLGHHNWQGRIYGSGSANARLFSRWRIYYGVWGSGLFQSIYERAPETWRSLLLMPEWYLASATLALLSLIGILWSPMLLALPALIIVAGVSLVEAGLNAAKAPIPFKPNAVFDRLQRRLLTAFLHLLQPLGRLCGRLRHGLAPWRRQGKPAFAFPRPRTSTIRSEHWRASEERLATLKALLRERGVVVKTGGEFDRWDLEVRGGMFGMMRIRMASEEHGAGKQMLRFLSWPKLSVEALGLTSLFAALAIAAAVDHASPAAFIVGGISGLVAYRTFGDCAIAASSCLQALESLCGTEEKTFDEHQENRCPNAH
jgi:GT2 family glycosyltransferase